MKKLDLAHWNPVRQEVIEAVTRAVSQALIEGEDGAPEVRAESLLAEALFLEEQRMRAVGASRKERILWQGVRACLLTDAPNSELYLQKIEQVVRHYADEIAGRFNPVVYWVAIRVVPWLFSLLLCSARVKNFLPWRVRENLDTKLRITGAVEKFQAAATEGTVVLLPTHQSNLDSLVIGYVIHRMGLGPFAYGAGLNLFSNPILAFFMSNLGAYTVDRKKKDPIYKATLKGFSAEILRRGVNSVFFPGGTRSRSGAVEQKLKLGLLGSVIKSWQSTGQKTTLVPMVLNYHFVFEAHSLMDDYLKESGRHHYISRREQIGVMLQALRFFWRLFKSNTDILVRIGEPIEVTHADVARYGEQIAQAFKQNVTALCSQVVAVALYECICENNPGLDLFRIARLPRKRWRVSAAQFNQKAIDLRLSYIEKARRGELQVDSELLDIPFPEWVHRGVEQMNQFHGKKVIRLHGAFVSTEEFALLAYYRNRLV